MAGPATTGPVDMEAVDAGMLRQPEENAGEAERAMAGSHQSEPLPCLALCGEFSAGKSSIVNLLLGRDMLPTSVLSSTRRPTYLRYAPELRIEAVTESGQRETVFPEAIGELVREDISHFDVGMPSELLRGVELLDTPGFADPFHDHQRTLDAVEGADICIWCTLATQAWRESERQTWLGLPSRFRSNGILVVTHVDTLAHRGEQQRVRIRLAREAGDLFGDVVLVSVLDAMRAAQSGGGIANPGLWRDSGGDALVGALDKVVTRYHAARGKSLDETEMPGAGFGIRPGFQPVASTAADAQQAEAPPEQVLGPSTSVAPRAETETEAASSASEPVEASESARFLARVMETVPCCIAASWVDLARREILLLRESGPETSNADGAVSAALGGAITDLFRGTNVRTIESAFRPARGQSEEGEHYFREIFITTQDGVGVFLRSTSRTDRALAIITDRSVNLGMVLSRARSLMASTDRLP